MTQHIQINTVIIPSMETQQEAFRFIEKLRQYAEPEFFVSEEGPFPHITLYAPEYPESQMSEIQNHLRQFAQESKGVYLPFSHIEVVQDGGVFFVYKETPEIDKMRFAIVEKLNGLRGGHVRQKYYNTERFNNEQKNDIEKFGYPFSFYKFPHITLCKFKNIEEAQAVIDALGELPCPPSLFVNILGLYEMGTFGRCIKLVDKYTL